MQFTPSFCTISVNDNVTDNVKKDEKIFKKKKKRKLLQIRESKMFKEMQREFVYFPFSTRVHLMVGK